MGEERRKVEKLNNDYVKEAKALREQQQKQLGKLGKLEKVAQEKITQEMASGRSKAPPPPAAFQDESTTG